MKVVILAGGLPSTISEERNLPKPMLRVGDRPLLWHIMKHYSSYGYNDFIICTGYRSEVIKDYFMNYYMYKSDITVDLKSNTVQLHNNETEPWKVSVIYTGEDTTTAERIGQVENLVDDEFIISYGDCITNIDVSEFVEAHKNSKKIMTLSLAQPTGRNKVLAIKGNLLEDSGDECSDAWANAGNMIVSKELFQYIYEGDRFEIETVNRLARSEQVNVYRHKGFWTPVETIRDREALEIMWKDKEITWFKDH